MYKLPNNRLKSSIDETLNKKKPDNELKAVSFDGSERKVAVSMVWLLTGTVVTIGLLIVVSVIALKVGPENLFNVLLYVLGLLNTMIFALFVRRK